MILTTLGPFTVRLIDGSTLESVTLSFTQDLMQLGSLKLTELLSGRWKLTPHPDEFGLILIALPLEN